MQRWDEHPALVLGLGSKDHGWRSGLPPGQFKHGCTLQHPAACPLSQMMGHTETQSLQIGCTAYRQRNPTDLRWELAARILPRIELVRDEKGRGFLWLCVRSPRDKPAASLLPNRCHIASGLARAPENSSTSIWELSSREKGT